MPLVVMPRFGRNRRLRTAAAGFFLLFGGGCASWFAPVYPPGSSPPYYAPALMNNPALVPVMDRDLVWEQVVDVINDYFKIEHEDRVRLVGDILTEGHLETYPCTGSTFFEPWKRDTVSDYERLQSTLQSIRRRAVVRVIPAEGGFLIDVAVFKELEDVGRPASGAISSAHSLRNDNSMGRKSIKPGSDQITLGWLPLGRDVGLEQQILGELQGRLGSFVIQPPTFVAPPAGPNFQLPPPPGGSVAPEVIPTPAAPLQPIPPATAPLGTPVTIPQ